MRARSIALSIASVLGLCVQPVQADAVMMVLNADSAGEGFNDATPTAPVRGNPGTTLGQQRLNALQYAADIWGQLLDSEVPIVIEANFDELECDDGAVLGQATTTLLHANFDNAPIADLWYPAALADRLERADLDEGEPDILAWFNSALDGLGCLGSSGWYYGFDDNHGTDINFVVVALHEIGHGLGSAMYTDLDTGELPGDEAYPTTESRFAFDRELGKYWSEMDDAERITSATNVRQVVWDGEHVVDALSDYLQPGMPEFNAAPRPPGLSGAIGEAEFGPALGSPPITGGLVYVDDGIEGGGAGTTRDGCEPFAGVTGMVALIDRGECFFTDKVSNAEDAGAIAVLIADFEPGGPPELLGVPDNPPTITIPSARISLEDGDLLKAALLNTAVTVDLGLDASRLAGESLPPSGVFLYAASPLDLGSSISHWDPITTPNLLMEPAINDDLPIDVDITIAQLRDIGWVPFECGNGAHEPGEDCDDGEANNDDTPDACRTDCRAAGCGDGVLDAGEECEGDTIDGDGCSSACLFEFCGDGTVNNSGTEECDDGEANNDDTPDACRSGCRRARCGDGVQDSGETCDDGDDNSNTTPGACRTSCQPQSCGDDIVDAAQGEQCDDGGGNSDTAANACRTDCSPPRCGDGVVDADETCDEGDDNSDTAPNACRTDCSDARCGDGVPDTDEQCDPGDTSPDALPCRLDCTVPVCGDDQLDADEACDDGNREGGDGCSASCEVEVPPTPPPPPTDAGDGDGDGDDETDPAPEPEPPAGDHGGDGDGDGETGEEVTPSDPPAARDDGVLATMADAGADDETAPEVQHAKGCGCRTPGGGTTHGHAWPALLLPLALIWRRTRRRGPQ